jgi:hypothetical protein
MIYILVAFWWHGIIKLGTGRLGVTFDEILNKW